MALHLGSRNSADVRDNADKERRWQVWAVFGAVVLPDEARAGR